MPMTSQPRFFEVRPNIFTATLDVEQTNLTLITGDSACLLVDTGSTPSEGAQIRQMVERITATQLTTVVLTHGHWDHAFGLSAFADLSTIGHENLTLDLTCTENQAWARKQGIDLKTLPLPSTSLAAIGVRNLGGISVEIAYLGQAHTRSDLILAIPQRSVIIAGDLVDTGPPQFDETSCLKGWVACLDCLYALLKNDTLVICGHGTPVTPEGVAHFRAGLAAIWDQAEWAFHEKIPLARVYDTNDMQWPWDRATVEKGIAVAYRACREMLFRARTRRAG